MLACDGPLDHRLLHAAEVGKAEPVMEKLGEISHMSPIPFVLSLSKHRLYFESHE
jgi:hypothetical protein